MKEEIIETTNIEHEFPEEEDMKAFRENPKNACEGMQRKYIGMTFAEYQESWKTIKDYDGPIGEFQELIEQEFINVYTKEKKVVKVLHDIPQPTPEEKIKARIQELRLKLINGTITEEEKEELKLLIG